MIGVVLAAGRGSRLGELTSALPKTLLDVAPDRTVLDIALDNLAAAGVDRIRIVTGFAAQHIDAAIARRENPLDPPIETAFNDKGEIWNNAHSLWVGVEGVDDDVLVCNGDTVHPPSVEADLIGARATSGVLLALDTNGELGEEEMKVVLDAEGKAAAISKMVDPDTAAGEYIGLSLIARTALEQVRAALVATVAADTDLYYEDGYQAAIAEGVEVRPVSVGPIEWTEIDDQEDLARARSISWLS